MYVITYSVGFLHSTKGNDMIFTATYGHVVIVFRFERR